MLCIKWFNNSLLVYYTLCTHVWNCHCGGQATIFGPKSAILYLLYSRARSTVCYYTSNLFSICLLYRYVWRFAGSALHVSLDRRRCLVFYSSNRKHIICTLQPCLLSRWIFLPVVYIFCIYDYCASLRSTVIWLDY